MTMPFAGPTTLANCEDEPIHVPGTIQAHGALLAFDAEGRLQTWSANAAEMLGIALAPGLGWDAIPLLRDALADDTRRAIEAIGSPHGTDATAVSATVGGQPADVLLHVHDGRMIVEVERRAQTDDELAAFALKAHRSLIELKRSRTVEAILQAAVEHVRELTGFDRVMAYRFRHDDSGDIVAEARIERLEPFLGRRYPASDIPAQARRLYILNTLRLIADVGSAPVPLLGLEGAAPLDLSHAVLRSVSPIHIEYLTNMGVAASMSVSIVIDERLWGMIACHHDSPKHIPHSVRMACDVIAQVLAASLQSLLTRDNTERLTAAVQLRASLSQSLLDAEDVLGSLRQHEEGLRRILRADGLILAEQAKLTTFGGIDEQLGSAIVNALAESDESDVVSRSRRDQWPPALQDRIGKWVGMLALPFDPAGRGWIVAMRVEQVETVRWGGRPEKTVKHGPNGPRLTPRGSFQEWRETVRDSAPPWTALTEQIGRELLAEARQATNVRYAALDRTRTQLLAMLGHDLRNPLQAISMAASMLQRGMDDTKIGTRLRTASGRMQRLVADVMDMSRLHTGLGLGMTRVPVDLTQLVGELVDEMRMAHPGIAYEIRSQPGVIAPLDRDRFAQVVNNLVSNARHHGAPGHPIGIEVTDDVDHVVVRVRNVGEPIPDDIASGMFAPFKRASLNHPTNRTGLGIGLYIAQQIVDGHGGTLAYRYEAPHVVFSVTVPMRASASEGSATAV